MHDIAQAAADAAEVPDYSVLARRGQRRRTARNGVALGVAALTVTGVVGLAQLVTPADDWGLPQPAPSPSPTPDLPSGSEPTILPYWQDGRLHVDGRTVETDLRNLRHGGGTTVVGTQYGEDAAWYLVDGSRLVPVLETDNPVSEVLVSPDGAVVALSEVLPGEEGFRLVLWDVESRTEVGSTVRGPQHTATGELFLDGIDLDHRVFFVDDAVRMWSAGQEPVTVGVEATLTRAQPWPGGLMYQEWEEGQDLPAGVYGTVDDSGAFQEAGMTPSAQTGLWSPDGVTYVFSAARADPARFARDGADAVWVQRGGSEPVRLPLPDARWQPVGWESTDQVVLNVPTEQPDPSGLPRVERLVRCDVAARSCTRVADAPTGPLVWAVAGPWAG